MSMRSFYGRKPPTYTERISSFLVNTSNEVEEEEEAGNNNVTIGRFQIMVGGLSPSVSIVQEQSIINWDNDNGHNKFELAPIINGSRDDLCILGGILIKLEQFALQDSNQSKCQRMGLVVIAWLLMGALALPGILAFASVSVTCMSYAAANDNSTLSLWTSSPNDNAIINTDDDMYICQDDPKTPAQFIGLAMYLVLVFSLSLGASIALGRHMRMQNWNEVEARLDRALEELYQELRSSQTGYTFSRYTNILGLCRWPYSSAGSMYVDIRRPFDDTTDHSSLPSVDPQLSVTTNMVTTIDLNAVVANRARERCLPVDHWVLGGLMLRLRLEHYRVSKNMRRIDQWLLVPLEWAILVAYLVYVAFFQQSDDDFGRWLLLTALLWLSFVIIPILRIYIQQCVDGAALSYVSESVVSDISQNIAEERHGQILQYAKCRTPWLTTREEIQFLQVQATSALGDDEELASQENYIV